MYPNKKPPVFPLGLGANTRTAGGPWWRIWMIKPPERRLAWVHSQAHLTPYVLWNHGLHLGICHLPDQFESLPGFWSKCHVLPSFCRGQCLICQGWVDPSRLWACWLEPFPVFSGRTRGGGEVLGWCRTHTYARQDLRLNLRRHGVLRGHAYNFKEQNGCRKHSIQVSLDDWRQEQVSEMKSPASQREEGTAKSSGE